MNTNFIRATKGYSSGKYYHESKVNDITSGCASYLCNRDHDISTGLNSIGYYADKDYPGIYIDNVLVHDTESYTSGDTIGTLLDLDNNTVSFYKNNKLIKTVDSHLIGEVYPAIASSISNLDVYTTFGHKEFDLPKEQWDELSSQGVIPYDEPSALWMGDKEYNNKAIYLNGTDSYISIPYNAKQRPTNAISGSMFVYVDTLLEDNNTLLEYNTLGGIHLYINSDKELVFGVMRGTDTIYSEVKYLIPDIYSHMYIGFSYDGQISRLFVNDTIVVEKDWLDIKTIKPGTNTILSIGKHPTENKNYFNGTIDEFSLFNIGMNEEDFILNSTRKISGYEDGCIGAYSFDYDTNGSIEDVSSSALNGILYNIEYVRAEVNLLESIYVDLIGRNINEVSIIKHNEIFDYINNHPDKIIVPEDRYEELYPLYTTNMKIDGVDNEYNIFKNIFNNEIDIHSISCGEYHATVLKSDGSLISWGYNNYNQVTNTPTDNDFIQVSCGTYHATALKSDGSLVSWGSNSNNEVTNTPTGNDFIQVSCGQNHATALKSDGSLVSWGRDTNNEVTNTPKGNDFIQVSCGQYHATALKKDGSLVSWGRDTERQVSNTPKGNDFIQVSCGFFHATALKKDGSLISWGLDTNNQVTNTPTGNDFIQVSCGVYHATALKSDGSLVSWGSNSNNVVSDTPTGNDFNIYSDMDIPINSIFDPILGTTVDSLDQLDGTFNYKPTYYSVINNVKYNNTKHIDKYLIKSNDLYIATGLNSVISSTQPVYYGLSESARVNQWNEGGNSIIEGKLFKDNLLLSTTDIDSLRNLTLSYNANIAPKMTDFTLDLSIIHDEHAVIRGNILDIEGENLEVTTTIVAPIKGTTTETMTVSHNYSYQKAFSLEDNLGVGSNTITITVKDPRGLSNTWSTTIVVENLNPILVIVYNDRYFSSLINDIESDRIKLKIENTTSKKILEETEYIDTPAYYKYTFKTGDTNFGVNNTILYTIEDELGGITTYSFTIKGVYRSLMFMDESGNYYTDDTGNLIKPLDFKIIRSGETTESKFVVSNDTSYDLKDLMLSPFYGDLPEGCLIEFSEDNINRPEWYERLIVPEVFKNNDTITVKMRVITPKNSVKMGASFGVDASGTIIVGRDGIEEDEVIELEKNGYRVE